MNSTLQLSPFTVLPAFRMDLSESVSGSRFAVALTHDVDRVHKSFQSITHFLKHLRRGNLEKALYQLRSAGCRERYWCFDKIRKIEISRGVRSTFFFLNETYPLSLVRIRSWRLALGYYDIFQPEVSGMIRQLDSEDFEIGLHGSYRSYNNRVLLAKEKSDLESILGHAVIGIRQHYLNLAPETWQIQRSLGFLYDASFGYRDRIGFKEDAYRQFPLDERNDFFVIPQAIMDCCLMRQSDPWSRVLELIDVAEKEKALLVLNWHQQIFDEREFPGYCGIYERIVDECIERDARFVSLGSYVKSLLASLNPPPVSLGNPAV